MADNIDGYWIRMGHIAADTLISEGVIPATDLTPEKISVIAEWFGGLLSDAHDMGFRVGESLGRFRRKVAKHD